MMKWFLATRICWQIDLQIKLCFSLLILQKQIPLQVLCSNFTSWELILNDINNKPLPFKGFSKLFINFITRSSKQFFLSRLSRKSNNSNIVSVTAVVAASFATFATFYAKFQIDKKLLCGLRKLILCKNLLLFFRPATGTPTCQVFLA